MVLAVPSSSPAVSVTRRLVLGAGVAAALADRGAARAATPPGVAVLYPDIGEPYRAVFSTIVEAIQQHAGPGVEAYAVGPQGSAPTVGGVELQRKDVRVLVALGRSGLMAAEALGRPFDIVAGCVLGVTEQQSRQYTVHSLAPDPALLFAHLRQLRPQVRRVHTVFAPNHNAWLMRLASAAARTLALELVARQADDLMQATRLHAELIDAIDPRGDALWLAQDAITVDESTLLPLVLRQSWQRGFTLVSSNVAHVRRGALLALYPDNAALGRTLALSAAEIVAGRRRQPLGLLPLRDVRVAANLRTAAHLGIALDPQAHRFDMLYPES